MHAWPTLRVPVHNHVCSSVLAVMLHALPLVQSPAVPLLQMMLSLACQAAAPLRRQQRQLIAVEQLVLRCANAQMTSAAAKWMLAWLTLHAQARNPVCFNVPVVTSMRCYLCT